MAESCAGCRDGAGFEHAISMAYQPIVDIQTGRIFAHEALVRGLNGEGAYTVLSAVDHANRYSFDQKCRVTAIEMASKLKLAKDDTNLSINFLPNAVYEPSACIRLTLATARKCEFPINQIIFEFTEDEKLDVGHLLNILRSYRSMGFKTAIDDFGAGYAGPNLLSKFQPDIVKLDMDLIRDIDKIPSKQIIAKHVLMILKELDIIAICEGVETTSEMSVLLDLGAKYIQGYLLAKPAFEALAVPNFLYQAAA